MKRRYLETRTEGERHDQSWGGFPQAGIRRRQVLKQLAAAGFVWGGALSAIRGAEGSGAGDEPLPTLPRLPLLEYRDASGLAYPIRRRSEWERRQRAIQAAFVEVAGPLPGREKRCPLQVQVLSEDDCGDFIRQDIRYQAEPGGVVPAYLLIPKTALAGKRAPGALCLHQTHAAGRKVVVGLGQSPDDEYGVELARRGYVCLAPAYPLLADYAPDVTGLGYKSGTMKAVWDNRRGLDLLESLPFVRGRRFAAIGHSLGGHNAIYTAVWDRRLAVVVTSCAFDAYLHYMRGNLGGWIQTRYLPGLEAYRGRPGEIPFDFHELIASVAPRALFANAPKGDGNFRWRSVAMIEAAVRPVYDLWKAGARLQFRYPEGGHRFQPEVRQEAYAFIEREL